MSRDLRDIAFRTIDGEPTSLRELAQDNTVLVVNVASRCGNTPQYEQLEQLQRRYGDQGFTVVGVPCNQFLGQEPGNAEDIKQFCSTTYGVTFPLTKKVRVNGFRRHPLFAELTKVPDTTGTTGDVKWNFEKYVISPTGKVTRFRPKILPDDPAVVAAIEEGLQEQRETARS